MSFCKFETGPSGSKKSREFLDYLSDCSVLLVFRIMNLIPLFFFMLSTSTFIVLIGVNCVALTRDGIF
jgi:hypothetical protein